MSDPQPDPQPDPRPDPASTPQALLVIDLQRDFFVDEELDRCREDLVATAHVLARATHAAGALVVEVRTEHEHDRSTWALNMRDDDQGMALVGTPGVEPVDGLDLAPDEVVVKTRDSAFARTDLAALLAARGVTSLVLAGVSTESCIAATATDAYARDLRVAIARDGVASYSREQHDRSLALLEALYRQPSPWARDVRFAAPPGRPASPPPA